MRANVDGTVFSSSMCPVVVQQVLSAFKVLLGEDGSTIGQCATTLRLSRPGGIRDSFFTFAVGKDKLASIRRNSNYFRKALRDMGVEVLGDDDSPVIPIMLFNPAKIGAFSRECMKRGVRSHPWYVALDSVADNVWCARAVGGCGCGLPCHAPR
jgi:serine palmitoyltransferase